MTNNRRVLVVLGMDRSGTSLCTNVLSALGMSLGADLLAADRFNERGYFEDREIWRLHERMLAVLGRSWDTLATVRPFPPLWWQSPPMESFRQQLAEIARARISAASGSIWGFKDPRTILLLPLWKAVFHDLGVQPVFIVCVRHPGAVAQSLAARDRFPTLFSELLWLEKTLTACLESWDAPNCIIHYEDWFVQPWRSTETLIKTCGLSPALNAQEIQAAVASIVSREMRHDTDGSLQIHSRAAADLYGYLLDYSRVPESKILRGFETALAVTGEFIAGLEEMAGRKLPCSICAPSYIHCTDQDLELIQKDPSGGPDLLPQHDPALIRVQLLLAEQEGQLRDYAKALAHAETLVRQRDADLKMYTVQQQLLAERDARIKQYAEALAHAQALVQERDTELKQHAAALAHAQALVFEQNADLKRYIDALAEAQRVVAEQELQLRQADVMREPT